MEYTWDDILATGHTLIDEQHKQLFAALNNLLKAYNSGKDSGGLAKELDFLTNYTIKHFFDEEQLQQKYNYPDYENHKRYHEEFKKVVRNFNVEFIMKGSSEALIKDIQTKIGDWLVSHIKVQDFKLAAHIKAQGGLS